MSRRLIAHEVVHVSAALVRVVVADRPVVVRRISYPISHVMHALFEDVPRDVGRPDPLLIDRHTKYDTVHLIPQLLTYPYPS
eukprot:5312652-Pleurochrysis_carterae.AAC.1